MAYLQANVLSAYVFLAPAIVAGVVTLGVMQQIIRAFGRVEGSMQYLLKAWPTIIELASVYKRLREFERNIIIKNIQDNPIKDIKNEMNLLKRAHRFAGFTVLKSLDIPSVLIEMGSLSNKEDSKLLVSNSYQKKITSNIVKAVKNYFDWIENNN